VTEGLGDWTRTHTCGELRAADAGRTVTLMGWVHRRRDHGGLVFLDLRDRTGLAQCVFNPATSSGAHGRAEAVRGEFVLAVRGTVPAPDVFVSARGQPLTRSGFEYILTKHVQTAATSCPSLSAKRISPHVLRHTCALTVLQATKDLRKVSLWLGHAHMQTTEMYTRADPSVKLEALEAMIAPKLRSGRFKATDKLIASLTSRPVMRSNRPSR